MPDPFSTLIAETRDDGVRVLHLNRPEAANALNTAMAEEIKIFFEEVTEACRAVVVTGRGRHFCAGADLKDRHGMQEPQWQAQHHAFEAAHRALLHCPAPVIAAVHGAAFGGGLELALACDFIYAAENARFALPETTLGIMPGLGGTQLLPRRIGYARTAEIIYLGRPITAAEALHLGLVNQLFPQAEMLKSAIACATAIACNAPLAVRAVKQALREGGDLPLNAALQRELVHYNTLLATRDRQEGINAFNEKRKPTFTGT